VTTPTEVKTSERAAERGKIARAASLISALTLVSRVFGLVRESVFAALVGAGYHSDAFRIGFRIPNLLRDLFAEGALSAAFVPTYVRAVKERGREGAFQLANRVLTFLAVVLAALVVLGIVFAHFIVVKMAPGFASAAGKIPLTVLLTQIMMPFLPLVSFAAVAMGMLNAAERFGPPALSPALFNVVTILFGAALWMMRLPPDQVVLGWAAGTLAGGLAQFLVQVPALWRAGWRFRPEWAPGDPALREMGRLMAPATVGLAAVQVNIFVNSWFASHDQGAVSWLDCAFRLLYLPIGLFGVALGTIATAGLARRAADRDTEGLRRTLRQTLSMLAYLTIPASAGLVAVGVPVVRLIYEHRRFTTWDTQATAAVLSLYSLGLVGYTGVKVLAPAFYALGWPRVPLLASVSAVATNVVVVLATFPFFSYGAIALGTALGSLMNVTILLAAFERHVGGLFGSGLFRGIGRMLPAAAAMGVVSWGLAAALERWLGTQGAVAQLAVGLVPVAIGVGLYGLLTHSLRVEEADALWGIARRRLGRARPTA
jgi:putative peptidoglycan lipid II flippase